MADISETCNGQVILCMAGARVAAGVRVTARVAAKVRGEYT